MKYKEIVKNNLKFIIIMIVVIMLGIVGIAFAINIDTFNPVGINITTSTLGANIVYLNNSSSTITSSDKLIPVNDSIEITSDTTNENILKVEFKISGVSTNPNNTIVDIALHNINMDCELKSEYFKWKLYKNSALLNNGSFSPTYDSMPNNRMVLTEIQEDLTTNEDTYILLIYIGESCIGDIDTCNFEYDQSKFINKSFSATMKLELSTGNKKNNTRVTSSNSACNYTKVNIPSCNTLTYNGNSQTLVEGETGYTLVNSAGTNAGNHTVVAKLDEGYEWSTGSSEDQAINCSIARKEIIIKASDQTIDYNSNITNDTTKITTEGLVSGHSVNYIHLYTSQYEIGTGVIYASAAKITDSNGNDVTDNYYIIYDNGTVTIQ